MSFTSTIEVSKVNAAGQDLIDNTNKMYSALNAISNEISGSSACFDSPAGAALRTQFAKTAAEFETFKSFLHQYGEFLKLHAGNVTAFESAVEEGLSAIPQI